MFSVHQLGFQHDGLRSWSLCAAGGVRQIPFGVYQPSAPVYEASSAPLHDNGL